MNRRAPAIVVPIVALAALLAAAPGCRDAAPPAEAGAGSAAVEWSGEGFTASLAVAPTSTTTVERVRAVVRVRTDDDEVSGAAIELEESDPADWVVRRDAPAESGPLPAEPGWAGSGRSVGRAVFVLEPRAAGALATPSFVVTATGGTGPMGEGAASGPGPVVEVASVLVAGEEDDGFAEAKGVVEPGWPAAWIASLVGAAALLVGGIAAVAVIGGRAWLDARSRPIARPAHEVALEQLDALDPGDPERHVEGVTDVVRRYLGDRFGARAPERTTEELVEQARRTGSLPPVVIEEVGSMLGTADRVKFARASAAPELARACAESARELIVRTGRDDAVVYFTRRGRRLTEAELARRVRGGAA